MLNTYLEDQKFNGGGTAEAAERDVAGRQEWLKD
jgi:hypothetical protein